MQYQQVLIIGGGILALILIWGLIGAAQASDIGISCNMGIGDSLCWFWEQNAIGDIQELFGDI